VGDWAVANVHGIVRQVLQSSEQAQFTAKDKTIDLQFDGGQIVVGNTMVRVGEYPLLASGSKYLLWFQVDPTGQRWYPLQPFRIDSDDRLRRVEFVSLQPIVVDTPRSG
jgi:hypothetical protein